MHMDIISLVDEALCRFCQEDPCRMLLCGLDKTVETETEAYIEKFLSRLTGLVEKTKLEEENKLIKRTTINQKSSFWI